MFTRIYELLKSICRESPESIAFLQKINTSKEYDSDIILRILKSVIIECGDDIDLYQEALFEESQFLQNNEAELSMIKSIFDTDNVQLKNKLIFDTKLHKESHCNITFSSYCDMAKHLNHFVFTKDKIVFSSGSYFIKGPYCWEEVIAGKTYNGLSDEYLRYIMQQDYKIQKNDKIQHFDNPGLWESLFKAARLLIHKDKKFKFNLYHSCKGKVFFKNGSYNFATKKFTKGDHHTMKHLDFNYNPIVDLESRKKINDIILDPFFTIRPYEHETNATRIMYKNLYLNRMALALSGNGSNKEPMFYCGERGGGKSAVSALALNSFGTENGYGRVFDLQIMKENKGEDVLKFMSLWEPYMFIRLAVSNETQGEGKLTLCGNKFKKIFSGQDTVQFRKLYKEAETGVINPTLLGFGNDFPVINMKDADAKVIKMHLNTIYYKNDSDKKDRTGFYYLKADPDSVDPLLIDTRIHQEFIRMLIENYETDAPIPGEVIEEQQSDIVDVVDIIKEKFDNMYDGTNEKDWFVSYADINSHLEQEEKIHSIRLRNLFKDAFGESNISPRLEKNKRVRGIWGIKLKDFE